MNTKSQSFRAVASGEYGFGAKGSILLAVHNWAGIEIKKAVFASLRKPQETTVFDDSRLAFLKERRKDVTEDTEMPVVDSLQCTRAFAASLVLLGWHIATPNPEDGKRPVNLEKYIRTIKTIVEDSAEWAYSTSKDADKIREDYGHLKMDPTEALAALKASKLAEFTEHFQPYIKEFWEAVAMFKECTDEQELIDVLDEALADNYHISDDVAGKVNAPFHFVLKAAVGNMDVQRKRAKAKQRTYVDPGIAALERIAEELGIFKLPAKAAPAAAE